MCARTDADYNRKCTQAVCDQHAPAVAKEAHPASSVLLFDVTVNLSSPDVTTVTHIDSGDDAKPGCDFNQGVNKGTPLCVT